MELQAEHTELAAVSDSWGSSIGGGAGGDEGLALFPSGVCRSRIAPVASPEQWQPVYLAELWAVKVWNPH